MTKKITFYILQAPTTKSRDLHSCRIVEKAIFNKNKVYAYFTDESEAQNFDIQLWTFRDISFIPHAIYKHSMDELYAPYPHVLIGLNIDPPEEQNDILINFSYDVPPFFHKFQRIIEVVPNIPELKNQARVHYKFYQAQNYQIETHKL